jgi:hypothetical protein
MILDTNGNRECTSFLLGCPQQLAQGLHLEISFQGLLYGLLLDCDILQCALLDLLSVQMT